MIHTTSDSSGVMVSIKNSTIQHSAVYCILQGFYTQLDVTGTTFASCASGNILKQP